MQKHEMETHDKTQKQRRGCILKLLMVWLTIGAVIIITIIYVRHISVTREPKAIMADLSRFMDVTLPEGFYPYSMNKLMGVKLYSFWNEKHKREDGRTTSVIAVYFDDRWRDMRVEEAQAMFFDDLEERLSKREFRVKSKREERVVSDGEAIVIHVFSGIQLMEDTFVEATACYRFLQGPEGPLQIHAMGLDETFGPEQQVHAIAAFKIKPYPPAREP